MATHPYLHWEANSNLYDTTNNQVIYFYLENDADRTPKTGLTGGSAPTLDLWLLTSGPTSLTGVELDSSNHPGVYAFTLSAANTATLGVAGILLIPDSVASSTWMPQAMQINFTPNFDNLKGNNSDSKSLEGVRDFFDSNLDTLIQTGIGTTELSGSGWLSEISAAARKWADEPALSPKFDPADMLRLIRECSRETFNDYLTMGESQIIVRADITLVTDQQDYVLPPNIGRIWGIGKYNSDSDSLRWELNSSTPLDPASFGYTIEGNLLRLNTKYTWSSDDVVTVYYVPNGDIHPHKGSLTWATTADISADGLTVKLPTTATDGVIDQRQSAFGGYVFRILGSTVAGDGIEQSIPIAASTISTTGTPTVTLTLRRPLNPIPDEAQTITYEVIPAYSKIFEDVVAIQVARSMLTSIGNKKRFDLLTQRLREKARVMRLQISKVDMRNASRFDNRTWDNRDLGFAWAQV